MADNPVYSPTTAANPKSSICLVPSAHLNRPRFFLKVTEVVLSFIAFILEETVSSCSTESCSALYFFEFVSCTAFLFTLLLLVLLSTPLHKKVEITCWSSLDVGYTGVIAVLLIISSSVFISNSGGLTQAIIAAIFGFLATGVFVADVFLMWKDGKIPFLNKGNKSPSSNGVPASPETEGLNSVANGP